MTRKLAAYAAGLMACSAFTAPAAFAQDNEQLAAPDENDGVIIVTATRRAADVQDIPIAVTAVTPEQLDQQGIANIQTLGAVAPSFNIQSSQTESQGTSIRIRGVGTTGNNIGLESAVGVFIDGVYQSRPGIALGELVDVQQVEVLRGPQGTLFGRNTTAGALVVRNKAPDLNGFGGYVQGSYGNFNEFNLQGALNAPLGDTAAVRFTGTYRERDGFTTNPVNDTESYNRDRYLVRGQLLWEPSADVSIKLIADYQATDENCCDSVTLSGAQGAPAAVTATLFPNGVQSTPGQADLNEFPGQIERITNSQGFENDIEQWGVSAELNWTLSDSVDFTVIGSYRDFIGESRQDDFNGTLAYSVSGATFPAGTPPTFDEIDTWTIEARLQGDAFDGKLDWLIGTFYSDERIVEEFALGFGPEFGLGIGPSFGLPAFALQGVADAGSIFSNGIFDPTDPGFAQGTFAPNPLGEQSALNRFEQEGTSFSIFTHNIFEVTDTLSLTLGARYVDDQKDARFNQLSSTGNACLASRTFFNGLLGALGAAGAGDPSGLAAIDGALTPIFGAAGSGALQIPGIAGAGAALNCFVFAAPASDGTAATAGLPEEFDDTFTDDEFIYTAQLGWEPNPDLLVYAGFTHGYKAGGFNLDATAAIGGADPRFNSEEIDAYELGIKATLLDGRVRANLALFHSDLADFQVLEFTGTQFQTFNVDDVSSSGFEVELFADWSDYISSSLAVTYTDSAYGDDCDASLIAAGGSNPAAGLCGFPLTNAPEWTAVAGMTYDGPINDSGWTMLVNTNLRFETDRRTSTNPQDGVGLVPFDVQDSNAKLNLRLGFTDPSDTYSIEFFGLNVTNEITRSITFNTPLVGSSAAGTASRSAFLESPRQYGVTVRAKF